MSVGTMPTRRDLDRVQNLGVLLGGVALVVCLIVGLARPATLLPPYLVGFIFWFGIGLGCLGLILLQNLVDGTWGRVIRFPLEAGAMILVPLAVLFIPLLLGMGTLYPWVAEAEHDPIIQHKSPYLNPTAFTLRAIVYFAFWIGLAFLVTRGAARRDRERDGRAARLLSVVSGPGLLLLFVSGTFAAIDWMMSLEPHWYSSLYGPMLIMGWALATFATMVLVTTRYTGDEPLPGPGTTNRWHDLGNLMLAFVMLWAYMSFSQYLIIYSGNLAEEIPWYLRRTRGGWQWFAAALIAFQFFAPFFMLLSRESKRKGRSLAMIAGLVLVMHLVDTTWLILPAHESVQNPTIPWLQVLLVPLAVVAIGGFCVATFVWFLKGKNLNSRDASSLGAAVDQPGGH